MRQIIRSLLRTPAFTVSTVVTIALGVGANTGAFSAIYTLLLKPLPYPEPGRMVALYETTIDRKIRGVAESNLLDWQTRSALFDSMAAFRPRSFGLTLGQRDSVTVIQTGMVMAGFFPVVRTPPALGRVFNADEEAAAAPVIVLTNRLWRKAFAADLAIIGRKIYLNEEPLTVIGVMPGGFEYPMDRVLPDAFIPLSRKDYCCGRLGSLSAAARLKLGVSLSAAQSELDSIAAALAREHPESNRGRGVGLRPLQDAMTGARREPLLLLLWAAGLLLSIACANVAGLILARWFARSHELAVRVSLGAGVAVIARQCFAEAAALSMAGAAAGLLTAGVILRAVPKYVPGAGQTEPLRLDSAAFAFASVLACAVTVLLGAAPLLIVGRADLNGLLRGQTGRRPNARGLRGGLREALVVAQIALCVVLLLGTGLLLRSFLGLLAANPGFQTAHALEFGIGLPEKRYDTEWKLIDFHRDLLSKLSVIPGVESAAAALQLPLRGAIGAGGFFQIDGSGIPLPQQSRAWINSVTPGYFATMGIALIEGRDFSWQEDRPGRGQRLVAAVNRAFVRSYLSGRPLLGTQLEPHWQTDLTPPGSKWEIVGVVADTRQNSLDHDSIPEIFLSLTQLGTEGASYIIRTRRDDPALAKAIADAVAAQDPRIQRIGVKRLRDIVESTLDSRAAAVRLIGAFGGLALLLTAVGIYGIVAFRAAERSREMAIRMALGANPGEIRGLVLGHGFRLTCAGTAAGLAAFLLASPLLKSQLYGVGPTDPLSLAAVGVAVVTVSLLASAAPSRRAAKAEPMDLLRGN